MPTFSCQLVHKSRALNTAVEAWHRLKGHGFTPDAIVDVGAASGEWTKELSAIFPSCRFLMVDPLEENRPSLENVVHANKNDQIRMSLVAAALTVTPQQAWTKEVIHVTAEDAMNIVSQTPNSTPFTKLS
jgi:FkbM family methyltransferase